MARALCQSPAPSAPGTPEQPPVQYSVSLDSFASMQLSSPFAASNLLRNFDIQNNNVELSGLTLTTQLSHGPFGFHVDSGYGEIYKRINAGDPWGGVNRYLGQAYVTVHPLKSYDLVLDYGKFYTSAGAEVVDTASNFNYSRSLLFVLGTPYYHFGFRSSMPVTKELSVGVQVVNGWNDVVNNTHGQTLGLTSTYTRKKFNWSGTYLVGPEPVFVSSGFLTPAKIPTQDRQLFDSVFKLTPSSTVNAYVETLYGTQKSFTVGNDKWWGVAGAVQIPLGARWMASPRWEYFDDVTGATSGTKQQLQSLTGTLQYKFRKFPVTARTEYRCDFSDKNFFTDNPAKVGARQQQTALVALLYTWQGK